MVVKGNAQYRASVTLEYRIPMQAAENWFGVVNPGIIVMAVPAGVEMRLERYTNSESTSGSFGICYTHPLKHVAHEGSRSCNTDAWAAPA
jgi:hypothetical protein